MSQGFVVVSSEGKVRPRIGADGGGRGDDGTVGLREVAEVVIGRGRAGARAAAGAVLDDQVAGCAEIEAAGVASDVVAFEAIIGMLFSCGEAVGDTSPTAASAADCESP